jgi:hypothetical protein
MAKLAKKEMQAFIKAKLRKAGEALTTIGIEDIAEEIDLEKYVLRSGREGGEYLQLVGAEGWINISIGQSVTLTKKGDKRIDELLENYVVYCGWNDREGNKRETPWFAFGSEGDSEASIIAQKNYEAEEATVGSKRGA